MTNHLTDLRAYMDIAGTTYRSFQDPIHPQDEKIVIEVAPDEDTLLEDLELLKFKLLNHRQMTGSEEYALGYEEACLKVVEMLDGIIRNHQHEDF
ncbi:hypothetical protein D3C87_482600 [compost metagenome]